MKVLKKSIAVLMIAVMFIGIVFIGNNETIQADELAELQSQIDSLVNQQGSIQAQKSQTEAELYALQDQKNISENNLAWLNERSQEQQDAYHALKARQDVVLDMLNTAITNLDTARNNFENKKEQYGERIETMFGMQHKSVIELLLSSESLEGFFTSVKFMRIVSDEDEAALAELKNDQKELEALTAETQKNVEANEAELSNIQSILDELESDIDFQVSEISNFNQSINVVNEQLDTYAAMESELQAALAQANQNYAAIEAEREAARIAAEQERQRQAEAKAAAEAAAKRAAEQQALDSQNVDVSDSSGGNENSGSVYEESAPSYSGGALVWPVPSSYTVSSTFGYRSFMMNGAPYSDFHTGIDISAPTGSPFVAPASGVVTYAGWMNVSGNTIIIDHGNGIQTMGCHLSGFAVSVGQSVAAGQTVGYVGSTGFSTGPHLHFEVRVGGSSVNPAGYLY